jgi:hypothetical protein
MALSGVQRCFQNVAFVFVELLADFHKVVDIVRGAVTEKVHEIGLDEMYKEIKSNVKGW